MKLDRFYLIAESARWIERLVPLGVKLVQLRMKDKPLDVVRREIIAAKGICESAGAQLIVNDYWQLAIDEGCSFVHLGQTDLETADVPALRRAGIKLGISTHDHRELDRALAFDPDYVALGPIYPTILKNMPWAPQGLERIAEWKRLIGSKPLVAIGGLTVARLPDVFAAGADSAAVVTDISQHPDPEMRTREWLAATRVAESVGA
ncbi:MAG TPA: thiamine phosphate synthase [Steroidobacteraceae bacterium]|nr:thiamine phosphate synthase [Steroidobacteraceae bacterium]